MRIHVNILIVALISVQVLGQVGCGGRYRELCCLEYNAETDQTTYCNNFRNVVMAFIKESDGSERRGRLDSFKVFYESIKNCQKVGCINDAVNNQMNLPGFKEYYDNEQMYSEQDTNIPDNQKAELILCGFKHAIDAIESRM